MGCVGARVRARVGVGAMVGVGARVWVGVRVLARHEIAPKDMPGKMKKLFTCPGSRVLPLTWSGLGLGLVRAGERVRVAIMVRVRGRGRARVAEPAPRRSNLPTYFPTH